MPKGYSLNQSLVDSHFKGIPGLRSFTARGFTCGNLQRISITFPVESKEPRGLNTLREFQHSKIKEGKQRKGLVNLQSLSGETNGSLRTEVLGLGALDELLADCPAN
jgi:hypothetical protein